MKNFSAERQTEGQGGGGGRYLEFPPRTPRPGGELGRASRSHPRPPRPPGMPKAKAPAKARGGGAAAPAPAPAAPAGAELEVPALEAQVKKEEARVKKLTTMLAKANDALAVCRDRLAKAKGIEAVGRDWRDWAALPDNVLKRVATILAQDADADYEARLAPYAGALVVRRSGGNVEHRWPCKAEGFPNGRSTSGLLFFALACRGWRNAQRELGPLRTRLSDVLVHDKLELFHLFRAGKNPMPKRWTPPYNTPFVYLYDKDLAQVAASCGALECLKWMHAKKDQGWKGLKSHSPVNFSALRAGQKKVFEWMYQIYKDGDEKVREHAPATRQASHQGLTKNNR